MSNMRYHKCKLKCYMWNPWKTHWALALVKGIREPHEVKNFFFTSCASLIPFTRANAQWVFHGFHIAPGAIIGDGDRKSWDSRGPMIWDNFSIFRTNCAILTSWIHARVVGSRVEVVTLRDRLLRVARYSCRFFTAMAGNKVEKKNQGSSVYFNALM